MHVFDSVTLLHDRNRLADGTERSFDPLGVPEGGTLALHAREMVVERGHLPARQVLR